MASSSSSSSSASTSEHQDLHHHPAVGGAGGSGIPAPPPPTPSNHNHSLTSAAADAALSRLLCQLTSPALSLPPRPTRLSSGAPAQPRRAPAPPVVSLVQPQEALLRSAASELGFFHLTDHGVPSHLPAAAQLECQSLFRTHLPDLSPLGFDFDAAGVGDDDGEGSSFLVFDMAAAAAAADQGLPPAVREYARHLEKVGMEVVEMLSRIGGFRNPFQGKASTATPRSLMWVSSSVDGRGEEADGGGVGDNDGTGGDGAAGPPPWGRCYPYAVCLQYEMRNWSRCLLLGDDAGWTAVAPHADSVFVAIGDIAQVWSDGGFKKVRGRPVPATHGSSGGEGNGVTISVLVTPSTDSVISPLPPAGEGGMISEDEERDGSNKFSAFAFEEYAWRLFHEQLPLTDPLRRYRLL